MTAINLFTPFFSMLLWGCMLHVAIDLLHHDGIDKFESTLAADKSTLAFVH